MFKNRPFGQENENIFFTFPEFRYQSPNILSATTFPQLSIAGNEAIRMLNKTPNNTTVSYCN
jgi:hypothetical protein